ncbi:MAG: ATP-grasp domain-containing protein [Dehalococcoidia bacterium]
MLLIPSESYRAPDFMEAAAKLGVEVVVGTDEASPLEELRPGKVAAFNFADPEAGADQIEAFAERWPLDTIFAVDDAGTRLAAHASRRLELPHNPVAAVEATRNKALLRERLAGAGVPSPPYWVVPTDAEPAAVAGELVFPVVVKPLALSASQGVIRADDAVSFAEALARVGRILGDPDVREGCGGLTDRVLVEGYIPGDEVSLEGVLADGRLRVLALFDKPDPLVGPYFEETIYVTPSRLDEERQREVAEVTERATAALGLRDGPVHAELRLNEQGAFPVDIAARSIGGLCSRTLRFGTGMSLEELLLRHAMGMEVASYERDAKAAGVMMLPIPHTGVLRAVDGVAEAQMVELIESVTITARVGQRIVALPEGNEYLGFVFARGETPEGVEAALREAHARLRFEIA